jgi:hypothetical protein
MSTPPTTADLASLPDPQQRRPGKPAPANIAQILHILHILLGYGRHLADTIERRAGARGFSVIARYFGTAKVAVILAHLYRGIMRAVVLERRLLARAARGRDLVVPPLRVRPERKAEPVPEAGMPQAAPAEPEARMAAPVRTPRADPDAPLDLAHLPTMEQLAAEDRRRPIGRVIADICRDLGVSPGLCAGSFWTELSDALTKYRGNPAGYYVGLHRRAKSLEQELDKRPGLDWPEGREAMRQVLGFFIGEVRDDPYSSEEMAGMAGAVAAAIRPP